MLKDKLLLIVTGCIAAALAWMFLYSVGDRYFDILILLLWFAASADNLRLRKENAALKKKIESAQVESV